MIKVSNLYKSYASQELFRDATFNVNPGERVGLVGRNGHGKTTLFKLILGLESADAGQINIPKNYRIGYLEQHLNFRQPNILEEACLGLPAGQAHDAWRAEKVLAGLGFTQNDLKRHPSEFSGGFQVRLNLAKVLVSDPDMLLLDEPTNYLDVISIRWLTRFLQSWKSELVLITHDRNFMDSVTTHTLGIHRLRLKKVEGGTGKYYEQIASEEEIYEKTRRNDEKRRREIEQFIRRFRAKARLANLVQSRIKTLSRQGSKDKLEKIETLEFSFRSSPFKAKTMMDVSDISFRFDRKTPTLFQDLSLSIQKDDRICIVGKNGKGKTTLLKVLDGALPPRTGEIRSHPSLQLGYFEQTNTAILDPRRTVEEEILSSSETCTNQLARNIAGAMMFTGDQALKKVSVLSGGEKSRLLLGKLLVSPCHMLLLDEPTNHLDMESSDSLMAAIDDFDGAVVLVTHNEMFLHTLANRLIVFDRGKQFIYEGSYQNFLSDVGWEDDERPIQSSNTAESDRSNVATVDKKALRKKKAAIIQKKSRVLRPLEQRNSELERTIEKLEAEHNEITQRLVQASTNGDAGAIAGLAKKENETKLQLETLYNDLDEVTRELEARTLEFAQKMAES